MIQENCLGRSACNFENVPCPRVFEIENHSCVDLKETIQLYGDHGANFNFAWDPSRGKGLKQNMEGLNSLGAMLDLLREVQAAMSKYVGVDDIKRNTPRLARSLSGVIPFSDASSSKHIITCGFSL